MKGQGGSQDASLTHRRENSSNREENPEGLLRGRTTNVERREAAGRPLINYKTLLLLPLFLQREREQEERKDRG